MRPRPTLADVIDEVCEEFRKDIRAHFAMEPKGPLYELYRDDPPAWPKQGDPETSDEELGRITRFLICTVIARRLGADEP